MELTMFKRSYLLAGLFATGVCGGAFYCYTRVCRAVPSADLIDFEYDRDFADIMSIFDRNWYWLMPYSREEYDPDYLQNVFAWRSPQANPFKKGSLIVKVIRKDDKVVAFTAYHMKTKTSGFLLFVAVDNDYRGKKYGEALVVYALKAMKDLGAKQIQLNTRIDNVPAQTLYKKMGFKEVMRQGIYVYYTYKV
jgi:ribosomal protein S18 acetylase RimI-like enzyme